MSEESTSSPALSELPFAGSWRVSQGDINEKALIVRVNDALRPFIGHPKLSHWAAVLASFRDPTEDGLPSAEEMPELDLIEDQLRETLHGTGRSVHAAVLTHDGVRQYFFYTAEPDEMEKLVTLAVSQLTPSTHEIGLKVTEDAAWDLFRNML